MLAKQELLTDENAFFVQKLCAEKQISAVALKCDTKNMCIFFKAGENIEVEHENLQRTPILGGRIGYKVVGIGEQIQVQPSEYRNAKILQK